MVSSGSILARLKKKVFHLVADRRLDQTPVLVKASPLSPQDAIGSTRRQDYVLLKGKERLLQAEVLGAKGQAFTSSLGDFSGSLADVLALPLTDDFQRAVFLACVNALVCSTGLQKNTIHCKNSGPELCAGEAADYIRKMCAPTSILMVGYQPALAEALNKEFNLKVVDLDPDNIGTVKNGVAIDDGRADLSAAIEKADLIFATGSTLCNDTFDLFYQNGKKPVLTFGTTSAGACALLGIPRFCPQSTSGE